MEVAVATDPGNRYGDLNQDNSLVKHFNGGTVLAVFDGHGLFGEKASEIAASSMAKEFEPDRTTPWQGGAEPDLEEARQFLTEVFHKAHSEIVKQYDALPQQYTFPDVQESQGHKKFHLSRRRSCEVPGDLDAENNEEIKISDPRHEGLIWISQGRNNTMPVDFGCTAVLAVATPSHVYIANAGDSAAMLASCDDDSGEITAKLLTEPHNPSNSVEVERLKSLEGQRKLSVGSDDGVYADVPLWRNLRTAVTRSLGHSFLAGFGLIPDPTVTKVSRNDNDFSLILCSDGVTDNVSESIICDLAAEGDTSQVCCDEIVKSATEGAQNPEDIDNVTCIVLRFPE